jgi:hypothetical protein
MRLKYHEFRSELFSSHSKFSYTAKELRTRRILILDQEVQCSNHSEAANSLEMKLDKNEKTKLKRQAAPILTQGPDASLLLRGKNSSYDGTS